VDEVWAGAIYKLDCQLLLSRGRAPLGRGGAARLGRTGGSGAFVPPTAFRPLLWPAVWDRVGQVAASCGLGLEGVAMSEWPSAGQEEWRLYRDQEERCGSGPCISGWCQGWRAGRGEVFHIVWALACPSRDCWGTSESIQLRPGRRVCGLRARRPRRTRSRRGTLQPLCACCFPRLVETELRLVQ
jgi:hypothetical protein